MKNAALTVAGLVFLGVAGMHFLRYFKAWEIVVDRFAVPIDWSMYGGGIALILALWMFVAVRR